MFRMRTTGLPILAAIALAAALSPNRPARAGIILAVANPQDNGVMVFDGSLEAYAPASSSPAHASAGNGRSSLNALGSQMRLSFSASGSALASTGVGPDPIYFGTIPIVIEGTAGEAKGTPVTLQLQTIGNVPPGAYTELFINGNAYSRNQTYNFNNFSVGSEFYLWAGVQSDGHGSYTMMVTLAVQGPAGLGGSIPEPSSLLLTSSWLVPIVVASVVRRRRNSGGRPVGHHGVAIAATD